MTNSLSKLKSIIKQQGPLTVAEYMEFCLGNYYRLFDPIGAQGDFVTAPEVSQMFGELIGLWVLNLWESSEVEGPVALIELGPGRGTLMADLLRAVKIRPQFLKQVSLHLLEINPYLQKQQAERLCNFPTTWYQDLNALLAACHDHTCFIIANEFFDALPIHQYVYQNGWYERMITHQKQLEFCLAEMPVEHKDLPQPKAGDVLEMSPQREKCFAQLLEHVQRTNGNMLLIDYGYTQPLYGDTLQAMRNHQFVDVLQDPGECDLTAHVSFGHLMDYQKDYPGLLFKLSTQGEFLYEQGIRIRAAQLCQNKSSQQIEQIQKDLDRLISPQAMGQLFKVLEVTQI